MSVCFPDYRTGGACAAPPSTQQTTRDSEFSVLCDFSAPTVVLRPYTSFHERMAVASSYLQRQQMALVYAKECSI